MYRVKTILSGLSRPTHSKFLVFCRHCSKTTKPASDSARKYATQAAAEPFLSGSSSVYVEQMFEAWERDPNSVHKSWDAYFQQAAHGVQPGQAYIRPPTLGGGSGMSVAAETLPAQSFTAAPVTSKEIEDHLSVQSIIRSYQIRGHHLAKLDPLGIDRANLEVEQSELSYTHYNFALVIECDRSKPAENRSMINGDTPRISNIFPYFTLQIYKNLQKSLKRRRYVPTLVTTLVPLISYGGFP